MRTNRRLNDQWNCGTISSQSPRERAATSGAACVSTACSCEAEARRSNEAVDLDKTAESFIYDRPLQMLAPERYPGCF